MDGNTYSNRLKFLLLCNSTVVKPDSPHPAFWWHLLEPGTHYVRIPRLEPGTAPAEFTKLVEVYLPAPQPLGCRQSSSPLLGPPNETLSYLHISHLRIAQQKVRQAQEYLTVM